MRTKYLITIYIFIILFVNINCSKKSKVVSEEKKDMIFSFIDKDYVVNTSNSKVKWIGKELSTKEHHGLLNIKNGTISFSKNGIINGNIILDMNSIDVKDLEGQWKEKLNGHLKSQDFFDIVNYPTSNLKFNGNINNKINEQYLFNGDLTIKGITHPISFASKIKNKNEMLIADAKLTFDRSLYDVRFGSGKFFENLGDKLIFDEIEVDVILITN